MKKNMAGQLKDLTWFVGKGQETVPWEMPYK